MSVAFSTVLALGLIYFVANDPESNVVLNLSSVTAFLLLCVFAIVNIACMILRRDHPEKTFFTSPGPTPLVAAALCLYLAGPWVDRDAVVYEIARGSVGAYYPEGNCLVPLDYIDPVSGTPSYKSIPVRITRAAA